MKNFSIKKFLFIAFVILALFLGVFYAGISYANNNRDDDDTKITETSLYSYLNDIAELNVVEYKYSKVGKFENSLSINGWTIPLTKKDFLLTYSGELKAGVNLEAADIEVKENKITIALPSVEITSNVIDEESIEVYDETNNIFNPIKVSDYTKFASNQKDVVEQEAIENGLLSDAATKVTKLIKNMVSSLPNVNEDCEIEVTFIEK